MRRLRRLLNKPRAEKELVRELRLHLQRQIADNLAAGIEPLVHTEFTKRSSSVH